MFQFVGDTDQGKGLAERGFEEEAGQPVPCVGSKQDVTTWLRAQQGRMESHSKGQEAWRQLVILTHPFQIIRKVVRRLDTDSMGDGRQHEEVIIQGSLQKPLEPEAEPDRFLSYATGQWESASSKVPEPCGQWFSPRAPAASSLSSVSCSTPISLLPWCSSVPPFPFPYFRLLTTALSLAF